MPALNAIPISVMAAPARKMRRLVQRVEVRARDWWRGETDETYFDLYDFSRLNAVLASHNCPPLHADLPQAEESPLGAARFILAILARHPHIRGLFPRALSDGPQGAYAQWIHEHARSLGMSAVGLANINEAFAAELGMRVRRVFELREDLRSVFPLGLTPKQRGEYLGWLVSIYGKKDFSITTEAALWYHFELEEDPTRGIAATYRLQPEWQSAVPNGLTRFGWDTLKNWIAQQYGFNCRWLQRATREQRYTPWEELRFLLQSNAALATSFPRKSLENRDAEAVCSWASAQGLPGIDRAWLDGLASAVRQGIPLQAGLNVIGLFRYTSGLQQAVRNCVESLGRSGVRTVLRDFPVLFLREPRNTTPFDALEEHDITIINTGLDTPISEAYRKSGLHPRPGVYRIGVWWWEMEQLPSKWHGRGQEVDEIWAPTSFIAEAMRKAFPDKPVYSMLPGMELPSFQPLTKSYFGLREDCLTFSFVFDMNSRMQRKNPLGLIKAFRQAFAKNDPVELAIKVSPPESYYQDQWDELRDASKAAGITLIDRVFSRSELLAFLAASDCYVSLHRSEGFGLTCAEAMLLGKPVIATGYSANLDFMTHQNSYLVNYDRVVLEEDIDPYPRGAVWADPHTDHAAEHMRRVFERRQEAVQIGERARQEVSEILSLKAAGDRMARRLAEIRSQRGGY